MEEAEDESFGTDHGGRQDRLLSSSSAPSEASKDYTANLDSQLEMKKKNRSLREESGTHMKPPPKPRLDEPLAIRISFPMNLETKVKNVPENSNSIQEMMQTMKRHLARL